MGEECEVILVEGRQLGVEDCLGLEVEAAHTLGALEVVVGGAGEASGNGSNARGTVGHTGNARNDLGGGSSDRSCDLRNVAHHAREAGIDADTG